MRNLLYFLASVMLVACSEVDEVDSVEKTEISEIETIEETDTSQTENERMKRDSVQVQPEAPAQLATYNAMWFRVEYPENFTPSPTGPTEMYGDYEYIATDEATFTSPDGTVEFFVYSPQWGGNPKDYLIQKSNEKVIEEKEDASDSDDPFAATHRWVTFEDNEGNYTRAYHSIKTESTHHVFGVKYTNRKMYERYKAAYMAFKNSLQQFAD